MASKNKIKMNKYMIK